MTGDPDAYEDPSIRWCANCDTEANGARKCESVPVPGGPACGAHLCHSCGRQRCADCGLALCWSCQAETPDGNGILCAACAEIREANPTGVMA